MFLTGKDLGGHIDGAVAKPATTKESTDTTKLTMGNELCQNLQLDLEFCGSTDCAQSAT